MKRATMLVLLLAMVIVAGVHSASAAVDIQDGCHTGSLMAVSIAYQDNITIIPEGALMIKNDCAGGNTIDWEDPVEVVLGDIEPGDVVISDTSIFVDSAARPDLDRPAKLYFKNVRFAIQPDLLKDGVLCVAPDCTNENWDVDTRTLSVDVSGFSNYSLQGLQEFTVYSDPEPELAGKVFQTIDLGDSYRSDDFKCVVQIYGQTDQGEYVLVQTNPQRKLPARILGNPDTNNPESLGYFQVENGIANVYFDGSTLAGYLDLEYVAMCASNSTKLVYEEPISTRYKPAGRNIVGRSVWFTSGSNAFYVIITLVVMILLIWLVAKWYRSVRFR